MSLNKIFKIISQHSLLIALFLVTSVLAQNKDYQYPFLNPGLEIDERVDDLIGRMTLEEKVDQMLSSAPAIERLGIPQYDWWNEALHGVARAGLATVFPQAIALGATWDEKLMFDISNSISDEARAKHHEFVRKDQRYRYQGLTIWSPNINIFRDPRWGRGQETYGEDPYLTGRLAVQFIKGLQGDDPNYYKTIATVKHFAVHSGPEPERHYFNAVTNQTDFLETYLPQFEMGIKEGKAYSLMCAYNRYNGEACCGSNELLIKILREKWGFEGFVVSDCGAIKDIHADHKIVSTPEEASALAVKAGTDLNCGFAYKSLVSAVEKDIITESEIDVSVKRLFKARFKLGMFDPPEMVDYTKIPYEIVDSKKHKELALETARKSIVLLKNENNMLPLNKEVKSVAVIGPNANQWLMLLGNYHGIPSKAYTPFEGIKEKLTNSEVLYAQGSGLADGMPVLDIIPPSVFDIDNQSGIAVEYFNSRDLSTTPLYSEIVKNIDVNWYDKAPREDMDGDDFGVRWTSNIIPKESGTYSLGIVSTCKTKVYLDDDLIIETKSFFGDEFASPRLLKSDEVSFEAGKKYKIVIEAEEAFADAQVQLVWSKPEDVLLEEAIEVAKKAEVVVMCVGLSAQMEGEEMEIDIDGFRGGDRTNIELPKMQQELIKKIHALGKPIVLVLLNGSALAINWENENIPSIIEAWYPGQAAGNAIADVIFGDYNPAGRLPVTFYKSADDLPPFEEYDITTQTYKYFDGEVLFPFGYGLSYTDFEYKNLKISDATDEEDSVLISVKVTNIGELDGDEVVQIYQSFHDAPVGVPIRTLIGFRRIHLQKGEEKVVEFSIPQKSFSIVINDGREVLPGNYTITVGGGQPDNKFLSNSGYLTSELKLFSSKK